MSGENKIPKHWQVKKLGEVCGFVRGPFGGSLKKEIFQTDGFAVYEQQHAIYNQFTNIRYFIDESKFNEMKRFELKSGDLIMSCSGTMGKVSIVPRNIKKGIINQALLKLSPSQHVSNVFLKIWMESVSFQDSLKSFSKGAAIQNVASVSVLKNIELPIPPLPEQQAIVAKIEELLSDLENGKQQLQTAQQQLKIYCQSLLKWAFEGRLTNKNVKDGKLPTGWKWMKFNNFCKIQRGHDLPLSKIEKGKYPVVTSAGVKGYHNEYKANGPCLTTGRSGGVGNIHFEEVDKYWPHNTVLFVKDFCGNKPKFIYYFFKQFNFKSFSASTAVPTLDRKQLYNELVPVPPILEQELIVQELESKLTVCDKIEETISQSLQQAETLRQSILKKAFVGKLV